MLIFILVRLPFGTISARNPYQKFEIKNKISIRKFNSGNQILIEIKVTE